MSTFVFKDNNKHLDTKSVLKINYIQTTIRDTDVSTVSNNMLSNSSDKRLSITYDSDSANHPTISYPDEKSIYHARKIHVYGLLHNNLRIVNAGQPQSQAQMQKRRRNRNQSEKNNSQTPSADDEPEFVGELVIENKSGSDTIYLCFLLKYSGNDTVSNDIDNVINNFYNNAATHKDSNTLNLKKHIQNSNVYVYNSKPVGTYLDSSVVKVMVFEDPIIVNSSYSRIDAFATTTSFFSIQPTLGKKQYKRIKYNINGIVYAKNNKNDTVDNDGIYIDCKPTGESNATIASYNVPINSEYTRDAQKIDFMKMTIQLCFVVIMMLVIYFVVPFFYKGAVIDGVNKFVNDTSNVYPKVKELLTNVKDLDINRFVRIRTADSVIVLYSFIIFGILLHEGYTGNNFDMIMMSLYFALMFGLGFSTVQFSKTNSEFMRTKIKTANGYKYEGRLYPDEKDDREAPNYLQMKDIIDFLSKTGTFIGKGLQGYNLIFMVFLTLLTLFILVVCKLANSITKWRSVGVWLGYMIFFVIIPGVPTFLISNMDSHGRIGNII